MYARDTTYREAEILGTSREQLVPLLYRHLLTSLRRAGREIGAGDFEAKAASLGRANDIVFELLGSLDQEQGGELAHRLAALYAWFGTEIREVGRSLDLARLERMAGLVEGLHAAWSEAAKLVEAKPHGAGSGDA